MLKVEDLLTRGYFPQELPPPFNTASFGQFIKTNVSSLPTSFKTGFFVTRPAIHNLARPGTLRRKISVPNPINQFRVAQCIVQNWSQLQAVSSLSSISLSKPVSKGLRGMRALDRANSFDELTVHKAKIRATSRYYLKADISRFYHSIYTHSIPWALHTKDLAKTNHTDSLFGNTLDKHIRNGQDAQTLGIPIGPDTSLLISEIILSAIEKNLEKSGKVKLRGYRYSDDYELGCESYAEAENTLAIIQECLNDYELALNPTKTKIIELPGILEASWVSALRSFTFRQGHRSQQYDLFRYFDTAFSLCGANKEDNILRYAIQRTSGVAIDKINWPLYEDLLLQCAMVEPGTLSFVFRQLEKYKSNDYKLTTDKVAEAFNNIIKQHAALGHGGEVAWALWGAISFGARIDEKSALLLADMLDPIVATLALDARSRGLIDGNVLFNKFASLMTKNDLTSENWLVAYEANIKGWLPSLQREDNVLSEPNFRLMKNGGVSFYNPNAPASSPFRFSSSTY